MGGEDDESTAGRLKQRLVALQSEHENLNSRFEALRGRTWEREHRWGADEERKTDTASVASTVSASAATATPHGVDLDEVVHLRSEVLCWKERCTRAEQLLAQAEAAQGDLVRLGAQFRELRHSVEETSRGKEEEAARRRAAEQSASAAQHTAAEERSTVLRLQQELEHVEGELATKGIMYENAVSHQQHLETELQRESQTRAALEREVERLREEAWKREGQLARVREELRLSQLAEQDIQALYQQVQTAYRETENEYHKHLSERQQQLETVREERRRDMEVAQQEREKVYQSEHMQHELELKLKEVQGFCHRLEQSKHQLGEELQARLRHHQQLLQACNDENAVLKEEVATARERAELAALEEAHAKEAVVAEQHEKRVLLQQLVEVQEELGRVRVASHSTNEALSSQLECSKVSLAQLERQHREALDEVHRLRTVNCDIAENLKEATAGLVRQEREGEVMGRKLAEMQAVVDEVGQLRADLQQCHDELARKAEALKREQERGEEAWRGREDAEQQLGEVKRQLSAAQQEICELLASMHETSSTHQRKIVETVNDIRELQHREQNATAKLHEATETIASLQRDAAADAERIHTAEGEVSHLREHVAELQEALQQTTARLTQAQHEVEVHRSHAADVEEAVKARQEMEVACHHRIASHQYCESTAHELVQRVSSLAKQVDAALTAIEETKASHGEVIRALWMLSSDLDTAHARLMVTAGQQAAQAIATARERAKSAVAHHLTEDEKRYLGVPRDASSRRSSREAVAPCARTLKTRYAELEKASQRLAAALRPHSEPSLASTATTAPTTPTNSTSQQSSRGVRRINSPIGRTVRRM